MTAAISTEAIEFLKQLRPPPWILIAIKPDGPITAITAHGAEDVDAFVSIHNGERNIYYSVNQTKMAMIKKPAKTDIAAVEYLLGDLDPLDDEKSEDAKARYLNQLNGTFEPKPTVIVDSGNGIQCLWKLAEPIVLDDVKVRESIIADVEARSAELMRRLGAKAGTQNIDRILRLPATTNLPNAKKSRAGRVPCPTRLLNFNGVSYPLDAFVPGAPEDGGHHTGQEDPKKNGRAAADVDALPVSERIKELIRGIDDPEYVYESRSEAVFAVVVALLSAKCPDRQIQDVMFDKRLPIGEHVREQPKPVDYLVRQIRHALAKSGGPDAVIREIKIKVRMEDILKSAAELRTKTFEPLRWVVPKYLPEGLTLLGGRPKIGKSWSALDAGVGVAEGGMCLGQQCEQGDVLALMLEDSDRRLQRRLTQMLGAQLREWPSRLTYATSWPKLRLHELATEAMISILVLHHQRKLGADDLIDTLSGTLGLGGAVDSVLILGKEQNQDSKFLWGRGRDLEEFAVSVKQNDKGRWEVLGQRQDEQSSPERAQVISVLSKSDRPMSIEEVTKACHKKYDRNKYNNMKKLLYLMTKEGYVDRIATGLYKLADPQNDIPF